MKIQVRKIAEKNYNIKTKMEKFIQKSINMKMDI